MLHTFDRDPLPKGIPGWHDLPVEEREKIRYAFDNKQRVKLVQQYGWDSDSDHENSNSRICDQ